MLKMITKTNNLLIIILIVLFLTNIQMLLLPNELSNNEFNYYMKINQYVCLNNATLHNSSGMSNFPYRTSGTLYYAEDVNINDVIIGDMIIYERESGQLVNHIVINAYEDYVITSPLINNDKEKVLRTQIKKRECFKK